MSLIRTVEEYVGRLAGHFWLTKRVPMTSMNKPLMNYTRTLYVEVYYTLQATALHGPAETIRKIVCYDCREKFKLYVFCYMHLKYAGPVRNSDFGVDEAMCDMCDETAVVWRKKKLILIDTE
ncbi:hypothetical protein [Alphabaculovirus altersperidaniae]|uniref:Uncharacterized protein n=1 Tax=Spodoptera eridania nucleopolyhedrovirus TaxID=2315721 RepID=A0ABX6TQH1_9ABAC|nr:hypothetical protein QKS47_gp021 [Spodoptera eridania nucleopolyhedrovirus]QNV47858.1 hypothetical protein [Spodoptera eridania nucleopolyhedrovirus]